MMQITFQEVSYQVEEGESVLTCLERQGVKIPNSCLSGICQSCLVKVKSGDIPKKAQNGLRTNQIEQKLAFACQLHACDGMEIITCEEGASEFNGVIAERRFLSSNVVEIAIELDDEFGFQAGQFIYLVRNDGLSRPYSIANLPGQGKVVLHVRKVQGGQMSNWLFDEACMSEKIRIRGPVGNCTYQDNHKSKELLLAGTGTGLAPLYGVVLDALQNGHESDIHLYHGAVDSSGLYLVAELEQLRDDVEQFHYYPCVLRGPESNYKVGPLDDVVNQHAISPENTIAYFCGDPKIVQIMKQKTFLRGVASRDIFSDPFVMRSVK